MGKLNIQGELDINSYLTAATTFYISSKDNTSIIFRHGSTEYARINPSGCLCINTTSTTDAYKLYVSGASLFSSSAYFRSNIWANNSTIGGSIAFLPTRSTDNNATGLINYYACGSTSATSYNLGSFYFTQYSYASGTYNRVEYYDRYNLPAVAADKTANNTYNILTTKNTITVAQGGTGRTTLTSGYALVGNGTSAVSLRAIATSATSGSTSLITSGGAYSIASEAITNITRSGTTFTATKIDGTTFTFTQQDNNTYGQTANTTSKIFLMGGTSQSASNKTTYSNVNCYASGGYLYSGSTKVSVEGHTHSYLPLSGGTITGSVNFSTSNLYYDLSTHTGGAIRLNNGDIGGVNSIYFKDAAGKGEGLHFYVSSTTVDTLRATGGVLYFDKTYDIEAGTAAATYTVIHSGNYTSYQVDSKVTQSLSNASNWRPILLHYINTTQGTDPGTATNQVYYNAKAAVNPSTGGIYSAGTVTCNRIIATSTTDAAYNAANSVGLIIGSASGTHIEMDNNEIFAKTSGTAAGTLYLQSGSGNTEISSGGVTTIGSLATFTNDEGGGFTFAGRIDVGCLLLTNTSWTGYGTADPEDAGLTKVKGRVYFKISS